MGATATAINLDQSGWSRYKPDDYKGSDLDNALKAFAEYRTKTLKIEVDKDLTLKGLKQAAEDVKKATEWMQKKVAALEAIQKAAQKTSGELRKKKDDDKWASAASFADSTGSEAASAAAKLK